MSADEVGPLTRWLVPMVAVLSVAVWLAVAVTLFERIR
jgi:hypothetical protein